MSSPFSPAHEKLMLIAAGVLLLIAGWGVIKTLRGKGSRGLTSMVQPILTLLVAGLLVTTALASSLVVRYALWLPLAAVAGFSALLLAGWYDRRGAAPLSIGTESSASATSVISQAMVYSALIAASIALIPLSLCCGVFGPSWRWPMLLSAGGFALAVHAGFLGEGKWGKRFSAVCPSGLTERFPDTARLRVPLVRAMRTLAVIAAVCIVVAFAASRRAGVPADNLPAVAQREHYRFTNHGTITEVTRVRYCTATIAGLMAWHSGALAALRVFLYGEKIGRS